MLSIIEEFESFHESFKILENLKKLQQEDFIDFISTLRIALYKTSSDVDKSNKIEWTLS